MSSRPRLILLACLALLVVLVVGGGIAYRLLTAEEPLPRAGGPSVVPVEVADIQFGPIEDRRVFSGTLQSPAEVRIAAKVSGRVVRLGVNLADEVARGQVIAELDSAEYRQEVAQADAELAVAQANLSEATAALEIAQRNLARNQELQQEGIISESAFDTVQSAELAARSRVEVARAQVLRAESALEASRIRLGYTLIAADWMGGDERRVVAERFVEEGDTVAANEPLVRIVVLDPIEAVVFVTEKDYAQLQPGQTVQMRTDAFPGEVFTGHVTRIAPTFNTASRQARVEMTVDNPDRLLKPGMFVRAQAVLTRVEQATIVPATALIERDGRPAIFVVEKDVARLVPVTLGIREGDRYQVIGDGIAGQVVTLGQQQLDDGYTVRIAEHRSVQPEDSTPVATASAEGSA